MRNLSEPTFLDEHLLLSQIAEGNKMAFNSVYKKYWQSTYTEAYKRLKDTDQAKDIVQEIFTYIWIKRESIHIENLAAYLHVAVRNKVFKLVEKQKLTHPFFEFLENIPTVHSQPDANLLWKEFLASYEALINTLPYKRQIIFRLRFQDDLSTTDIAKQLGLSRKTVQNQLGKAFEQLKLSINHIFMILIIIWLRK